MAVGSCDYAYAVDFCGISSENCDIASTIYGTAPLGGVPWEQADVDIAVASLAESALALNGCIDATGVDDVSTIAEAQRDEAWWSWEGNQECNGTAAVSSTMLANKSPNKLLEVVAWQTLPHVEVALHSRACMNPYAREFYPAAQEDAGTASSGLQQHAMASGQDTQVLQSVLRHLRQVEERAATVLQRRWRRRRRQQSVQYSSASVPAKDAVPVSATPDGVSVLGARSRTDREANRAEGSLWARWTPLGDSGDCTAWDPWAEAHWDRPEKWQWRGGASKPSSNDPWWSEDAAYKAGPQGRRARSGAAVRKSRSSARAVRGQSTTRRRSKSAKAQPEVVKLRWKPKKVDSLAECDVSDALPPESNAAKIPVEEAPDGMAEQTDQSEMAAWSSEVASIGILGSSEHAHSPERLGRDGSRRPSRATPHRAQQHPIGAPPPQPRSRSKSVRSKSARRDGSQKAAARSNNFDQTWSGYSQNLSKRQHDIGRTVGTSNPSSTAWPSSRGQYADFSNDALWDATPQIAQPVTPVRGIFPIALVGDGVRSEGDSWAAWAAPRNRTELPIGSAPPDPQLQRRSSPEPAQPLRRWGSSGPGARSPSTGNSRRIKRSAGVSYYPRGDVEAAGGRTESRGSRGNGEARGGRTESRGVGTSCLPSGALQWQ